MIAMLLGLVLMGAVVEIFITSKQSYNLQEAQSRLQENGRLAMNFLPYEVRKADFQGCRSRRQYSSNVIANPTASGAPDLDLSLWDINGGITGSDNVPAGTMVAGKTVVAGTDLINLQFAGSCGGHLVGNMTADNANIQIDGNNTCNLQQNWPYMITDCIDSDIFRASSVNNTGTIETTAHGNNVNNSNRLSKAYQADAEIYTVESVTYFIAQNPVGNNALYRTDNTRAKVGLPNSTMELVDGVEDMQILYGEDTDLDGTPNYYVDASNVVGMEKVVSVKISLLLRSMSDVVITSKPMTYTYNGVTYNDGTTPAPLVDRQLRKVFTSTVTLRNRLP